MNELWVARDRDEKMRHLACVSDRKPYRIDTRTGLWMHKRGTNCHHYAASQFPDLKPGECRRLVLAEETSE